MNKLSPEVQAFVERLELLFIPAERQEQLQKLTRYVQQKQKKGEAVNLNFICTHNSRRSQLCQVWAQTAAFYFGIDRLQAFSGGTEPTVFHPNAIRALKTAGFDIWTDNNLTKDISGEEDIFSEEVSAKKKGTNPVYRVRYSRQAAPLSCFSKVYDDPFNAAAPFAALMTCSDAETHCPFIPDAEARFSIKYHDPKKADRTPEEEQIYNERSRQIATEMFYVFSKVNS